MPIRVVHSWSNGILLEAAESFGRQFPESLLIGPRLLAGESGGLGIHRVSLAQAAREMARTRLADADLAPVGSLGVEALAARVVHRARGSLTYFNKIDQLPGFARALARTLTELRLARIQPARLDSTSPDLARLLSLYEEELEERALADTALVLELATEAARADQHRWLDLPTVFLDVPLDSPARRDFIDAVAARAPEVLRCELGASQESIQSSLDHLRDNLFKTEAAPFGDAEERLDGRFEYFSAPGEGLESVEIARRVLKLARQGVAFDSCAILLRHPDRYQPMVEDALRRARIPAYFSRGTRRPDPAGRAFLALLTCAAENYSASRFAEYLSLAQVPDYPHPAGWVAPEDEALADPESRPEPEAQPAPSKPTPHRWERLLVDAAVIGGRDRWQRRLDGLEAEWRLQEKPAELIEHLRNLRAFALPLIDALAALPRGSAWGDWTSALNTLALRSLRTPEGVLAALAELTPMSEVGPVLLEEVIEVLSDRLRFLRSEPPARRWGRVYVGSVDEARGRAFDIVFVPGLAEGLFPRRPSEDPLLLDELRTGIDEALPTRHKRVEEERGRLRAALAAAREHLIASYPRMEVAEARPRVPSFYALELPRALAGALPELKHFEEHARDAAPARLNWPAPRDAADAIDEAEYDLVAIGEARQTGRGGNYLVEVNEHLARSLRGRWLRWTKPAWNYADGLVTKNTDALAALEVQRLKSRPWSPSSLENFAYCPYKFALHGIYRLREREEAAPLQQLDPLTRGLLFHKIQEEWFQGPRTRESLEEAIENVAKQYAEQLAPAIERVWQSEIDDLRTDLRGWLDYREANESDWEPYRSEYEFKVELDSIHLRGKIDLIERHSSRGVFRVTDHKTGKRPEMVPRWVGGGKHLQPLLYSLAVEHAEREQGVQVEAGRLLYATQKGGYIPLEIALDARARQFVDKLLADIDASIAQGFLPPAPDKEACTICDYRIVCGPYEEQRLLKKDRRDERLDPLYEIRSMA